MTCEFGRVPSEGHEHALRHIFGRIRLAGQTEGRRINQINMPADQLGESGFGTALGVIVQ
jgi:hypothetical protein